MQGKVVEILIVMLFVMNAISPVLGSIEQQETFSDENSNKDYHESLLVNPYPLFNNDQSADTTMKTVGTSSTAVPEYHEACCERDSIPTTDGTTSIIPNDWFIFNQGLNQPTVIIDTPADHSIHDTRNVKIHGHGTASSTSCLVNKWQALIEYQDGSKHESGDLFFDEPGTSYWFEINPYNNWCNLKLGWNRITVTVYDQCGKSASAQITITYQDIFVPMVDITSPEDEDKFDDPHITLVIKADEPGTIPCDGSGIKKISWIHTWEDGEARDEHVESAPYIPERTITRPITLKPGENTIHAWATDWAESQGDVFDEVTVTYTPPVPPEILSITITGGIPPDTLNPTTNYDVTFKAEYTTPPGYKIHSLTWRYYDLVTFSDDTYSNLLGINNPWVTKPPAEKYGKKQVLCVLFYKNLETGEFNHDYKTKDFNLFFAKKGDHDSDGEPNWFEYWQKDGAVITLNAVQYDAREDGYGYYDPNVDIAYVCQIACDIHYPKSIVVGAESFGGPTVKGIDCAAEVVAHELYHKWVHSAWQKNGVFYDKKDSDRGVPTADYYDDLPDFYETSVSHTKIDNTDTFNIAKLKGNDYKFYGDQELMAMRSANDAARGIPTKDWANPGKQTNPSYATALIGDPYVPVDGEFTGTYTDQGVDSDGDGFYDFLTVTAGINVLIGGEFTILASLYDQNTNEITWINELVLMDEGVQGINLDFSGLSIRQSGKNGPYVVRVFLDDLFGNELDYQNNTYTTAAYAYTDFERKDAVCSGVYSDYGSDTDGDGLYDVLTIEVEVETVVQGEYTVDGYLYDSNEDPIVFARSTHYLDVGTQPVVLQFDGMNIAINEMNGPYTLYYLTLSDENNEKIDYHYTAYETTTYQYDDFITQNFTNPPNKPERPSGDTEGTPGVAYTFETMATDQDGDTLWYLWDWGDGNTSDWLGPYTSGATCRANYSWHAKGTYDIKVKARDLFGISSSWSDPLSIKMPHSYTRLIPHFFKVLFQRFPHAFPLLRQLLGY